MREAAATIPGVPEAIDHVFLDIGGVLYDDGVYAEAWRRALREAGGAVTHAAVEEEDAARRVAPSPPRGRRDVHRCGVRGRVRRVPRVAGPLVPCAPRDHVPRTRRRRARARGFRGAVLAVPALGLARRRGADAHRPPRRGLSPRRDREPTFTGPRGDGTRRARAVLRGVGCFGRPRAAQTRSGAVPADARAGARRRRSDGDGGGPARLRHAAGARGGDAPRVAASRGGTRRPDAGAARGARRDDRGTAAAARRAGRAQLSWRCFWSSLAAFSAVCERAMSGIS